MLRKICVPRVDTEHIEAETKWTPFPDDTFKAIFFYEMFFILINISLKFVPQGPFNNIPALIQIMAWCFDLNY